MVWLILLSLAITIFGNAEALNCFGHVCSPGTQYCSIHLHQQTGSCYTHGHSHGHQETHQLCIGSHHPGDHCYCADQSCVDIIERGFSHSRTTTHAPVITTQPPVMTSQVPVTMSKNTVTTSQAPSPTTIAIPVHIEAIQCFGTTCYTPDACGVIFINSIPVTGKCVSVVKTACGPFPELGECECDSSFCMDIVNTLTTTAGPPSNPTMPTTTTTSSGTPPILTCADKEDSAFSCKAFNDQYGMCLSTTQTLQNIAKTRCPKYCKICGTGATPTQAIVIGTTTTPPCVDHDTRCSVLSFKQQLCSNTNLDTRNYAISTCAKSCNLCQEYIASLTVSGNCNVCGDATNFIPCSTQEIKGNFTMKCSSDKQYCMTDLYQDSAGNKDVYKRCVDNSVCQSKWLTESADQDYCSKYGQVLNPSKFECHFCCIGDNCNTGILPSKSTLVVKPSGK